MKLLFRIVKYLVMGVGVVTLICLLISLCLFLLGESRLEWVDDSGYGNGCVHEVKDGEGWPIAYFRLCDYFSTNKTYLLEISETGLYGVQKQVTVRKYDRHGRCVAHGEVIPQAEKGERGKSVEIPSRFSPCEEDEVLILEFSLDSSASDKNGQCPKIIPKKFVSKVIRYQFSV